MKSALFMMELLIAILIFAVCAAVCVEMFAASFKMSDNSKDINNAIIISECGAESFKAAAGKAERTAVVLGGNIGENGVISVYYDENRLVCDEGQAVYYLNISYVNPPETPKNLTFGEITVTKADGEQLISFTAAARGYSE